MTPREIVLLHYINESVTALEELRLAAAEGSTGSEVILKYIADDLIRAAADARLTRKVLAGKPKGKLR